MKNNIPSSFWVKIFLFLHNNINVIIDYFLCTEFCGRMKTRMCWSFQNDKIYFAAICVEYFMNKPFIYYVPSVNKNGGQYTHAAIWAAMVYATLGDSQHTYELLIIINSLSDFS